MKNILALLCAVSLMIMGFSGCSSLNTVGLSDYQENGDLSIGDSSEDALSSPDILSQDILLGVIAPLSGDFAGYGTSIRNGINLAVDEINANGGINGYNIALQVKDDKGTPNDALTAYQELMETGINALIGSAASAPSGALAKSAAEGYQNGEGIPMITATGTEPSITLAGENVFRASFLDQSQGKAIASFAADNLECKKVAILYNPSYEYSKGIAEAFETNAIAKGMEVSAKETYGQPDEDLATTIATILEGEPDAILIPDYTPQVIRIVQQLREAEYTNPLLGGDGWDGILEAIPPASTPENTEDSDESDDADTDEEVSDPREIVNQCYYTSHCYIQEDSPAIAKFSATYLEKYGTAPNAFSALGYDSVFLIADAIQRAGTVDSQTLVAALKGSDYTGVTGKLAFDKNGNPTKDVVVIGIQDEALQLSAKVPA